jgi:type III pantothenate kinase
MSLLLDLGNTRLKATRVGSLLPPFALAHDAPEFDAEFARWLQRNVPPRTPVWLAAVAPEPVVVRVQALLAAQRVLVRRVHTQQDALGLHLAYAQPETLGVDRWLALLAAHARGATPALVVMVGSALTIDALQLDGRHLGGLIAPPPEAMRAALLARAPRLAGAEGRIERFATATADAVSSGCLLAAAALVERSLLELSTRSAASARLLLSGGGAAPLRPWLPPHEFATELVLEGLGRWAAHAGG